MTASYHQDQPSSAFDEPALALAAPSECPHHPARTIRELAMIWQPNPPLEELRQWHGGIVHSSVPLPLNRFRLADDVPPPTLAIPLGRHGSVRPTQIIRMPP